MIYSKNNIIVPIQSLLPPEYAILNPLTGAFDLMSETEYQVVMDFKETGRMDPRELDFYEYLLDRGYCFKNENAEAERVQQEFANFQTGLVNSQTQLLLIPSYGCNLACTYCYEQGVAGQTGLMEKETVDAFFDYIQQRFESDKLKPFITLFGGEPLMDTPVHRKIIGHILDRLAAGGYELAIVTNGVALSNYIELLSGVRIKEIQVTLDGSRDIHDQRRGTRNGKGSFDSIVSGLRAAIQQGFPINLRTVVDLQNLPDLVNLAQFAGDEGWLNLGPERFKTQLGRNYELFNCYAKPEHLMSQVELWAEFSRLSRDYPLLRKFHRPDFKGIRYLVDTGSMYMPSFDTCPAAKTEWVFDLHGDIYGCTAACGRKEFRLGTFYPRINLDKEQISQWQSRNVLTIPECHDCQYNIICGGGCGVIAVNESGRILSPNCRPIGELIDLGINYYQEEIRKLAEPEAAFSSGCRICGGELVYLDNSVETQCELCHKTFQTTVNCPNGHYICDGCHRGNILDQVAEMCMNTTLGDPVELARQIFDLPGLNMHGPEYHSIVPAIIVTTYANNTNTRKHNLIRNAIERGQKIPGGLCGTHGACGAGIGLGIAYSIIHQVTPMSRETRGEANRLTAEALLAISQYGGPRCCKRDALTTLEVARSLLPGFPKQEFYSYQCKQFKDNPDCLGKKCPYIPNPDLVKAETNDCCCQFVNKGRKG